MEEGVVRAVTVGSSPGEVTRRAAAAEVAAEAEAKR